jgi:hypothetical protein
MKLSVALTAASLIALSVAGAGGLYAGTNADTQSSKTVHEQFSGGPDVRQANQMSEHGLAAMNDIHLARIAVNDGYIDNATRLLKEARTLLDQVADVDPPVTVTTEIKVGDEPVKKETVTKKPDLIPILAEMQLVEGFTATDDAADAAKAEAAAQPGSTTTGSASSGDTPSADQQPNSDAKPADQVATAKSQPTTEQRAAAVKQAQRQMQNGDRQAAVETLRLVDLGLISRVVSMPLQETSTHVNTAMALIEQGKLHEANLELKRVKDGLIVDTSVAVEPADALVPSAAPSAPPAEKHSDAGSDAAAQSTNAG